MGAGGLGRLVLLVGLASYAHTHLLDTVTAGGYPSAGACPPPAHQPACSRAPPARPACPGKCGYASTPGCYENRLRIAVLTFATKGAHEMSIVSAWVNNMYTLKHGCAGSRWRAQPDPSPRVRSYDFIVERCAQSTVSNGSYTWDYNAPKGKSPAINWCAGRGSGWLVAEAVCRRSKHLFILKHLPFYDAVFYVDSDILFVDHSYTIEQFLDTYLPLNGTHTVAFGENCMNKDFCWNGFPGPNAGMMLFRNKPSAYEVLYDWANAGEDGRCDEWRHNHPLEQECFNILIWQRWRNAGVVAIPDTLLWKGSDGTWMMHAFSSGGLAMPPSIIPRMAMRSFLHLLGDEHPFLYWRLRNYTKGDGEQRGPPWKDKVEGLGALHGRPARAEQPDGMHVL